MTVLTEAGELSFTSDVEDWPRLAAYIRARCAEGEPAPAEKRRHPTVEELLQFLGPGSRLPMRLGVSPALTGCGGGFPLLFGLLLLVGPLIERLFPGLGASGGLIPALGLGIFPVWILLLRDWLKRWQRRVVVEATGLEVRDEKGRVQKYAWSEVLDVSQRHVSGSTIPEEYQVRMYWGKWEFDSSLYGYRRLAAALRGVLSLGPAYYPSERLLDIPDTALSRAPVGPAPQAGEAALSQASAPRPSPRRLPAESSEAVGNDVEILTSS